MENLEYGPIDAGQLRMKTVTKILRCGGHTVSVKVGAIVCLGCGKRIYLLNTINLFQKIRTKLKSQNLQDLDQTGHAFKIDT